MADGRKRLVEVKPSQSTRTADRPAQAGGRPRVCGPGGLDLPRRDGEGTPSWAASGQRAASEPLPPRPHGAKRLGTTCAPGAIRWDRAFRIAIRRRPGTACLPEDACLSSSGHGPAQFRPATSGPWMIKPSFFPEVTYHGTRSTRCGHPVARRWADLAGRPPVSARSLCCPGCPVSGGAGVLLRHDSLAICRRPAAVCQRRFPAVRPTARQTPPQDDSGPERARAATPPAPLACPGAADQTPWSAQRERLRAPLGRSSAGGHHLFRPDAATVLSGMAPGRQGSAGPVVASGSQRRPRPSTPE